MARLIPNERARLEYKQRMFFGLIVRPLRIGCDHCGRVVLSDIWWRCERCDGENDSTRIYSFLNRCRTCRQPPDAYECPHCAGINCLDEDERISAVARTRPRPKVVPPPPKEDPLTAKRRIHREQREDLLREIELTRLNAELAALKTMTEPPTKKDVRALLEESAADHDVRMMAVHAIAREQRAKNAVKYKDDPELLQMADESVQDWLENQLWR